MQNNQKVTVEKIQIWLKTWIAESINIDSNNIGLNDSLFSFGLESAQAITLALDIGSWLNSYVEPIVLFNHPNIEELSKYLFERTTS